MNVESPMSNKSEISKNKPNKATLEKYLLDIERIDDVPNTLVPDFYETYLKTENPGPLIPIIDHNKQDLISLASIFSRLWDEWLS